MSAVLNETLVTAVERLMALSEVTGDVNTPAFRETYTTLLDEHVKDLQKLKAKVMSADPSLQNLVCPIHLLESLDKGIEEPDTWGQLRDASM